MALNNSQYNAIMRIYSQRQLDDRYEQDLRRQKVYEEIPQIEQIEGEIRSLEVERARRLLDDDGEADEEIRGKLDELKACKESLLTEHGFAPDEMELKFCCDDCEDTGYVDGRKCHCFKKEEIKLLYAQSNIEDVLERENFDTFTYDYYDNVKEIPKIRMTVAAYMEKVNGWCREFVDDFDDKGGNLIFTGGTGTGKTFLTNCIAKELIDRYHSVIYMSSNDLFDVFSKNKFSHDTDEEIRDMYEYILDCDLLIIDDLGTELNNSFVSSQLFYCINERLIRKKSTIISTNLSMNNLRDAYSERVSSRIMSAYSVIPLYGDDIRIKLGAAP